MWKNAITWIFGLGAAYLVSCFIGPTIVVYADPSGVGKISNEGRWAGAGIYGVWCAFGCFILNFAARERHRIKQTKPLTMLILAMFLAIAVSWPLLILCLIYITTPFVINAFFSGIWPVDYRTVLPTSAAMFLIGLCSELAAVLGFTIAQKLLGLKNAT